MEPQSDRKGGRLTFSVVGRLVILVAASVISQGNGCSNLLNPTPATQTGFEQCGAINALYCNSPTIPQSLNDGVQGACCVVATNANASVGYLCAWGSNKQAAGCFATSTDAWETCKYSPNGSPNTVVRCTR